MTETPQPYTLLIADDIHPVFIETVEKAGFLVDYRPHISYEQALDAIANYEGLVLRSKFKVKADFIDAAKKLKIIARAGAGVDNIDVEYAERKGIHLVSAPEGNCDAVAEHMMGMLLALLHNLRKGDLEIRGGFWKREENRGVELGGKTIGLIGYGNNGQAMAHKLSGFGVNVLAYDKYRISYSDSFAKEATMDVIFKEADVVSLHIPLTAETRNMVNADFLGQFRKAIWLLNGSRGEVVAIEEVIKALHEKKIIAAAFDVLPIEKFPALTETSWFEELKTFPNVILSPHVAGWSVESYYKIAKILADKLVKAVRIS